jgi:multidrug efflux pump subunit AcrB
MTEFSLNNARVVLLVIGAIVLGALASLQDFPSQEDPPIKVREAFVVTYFPGMDPVRVERLITRPLERAINKVIERDNTWSFSKTGVSIIHIELKDRVYDMQTWWQDLRNKVIDATGELPEGTIGPFVNDEFGDVTIVSTALTAKGFSLAEMYLTAKEIMDQLYIVPGVGKVYLYGVQNERIWLEVSTAKLAQFGISTDQITSAFQKENIILPGGTVDVGGKEIVIEPTGNFDDIQDIENLRISVPDSDAVVYLRDLATITRGYVDPPQAPVFYNGEECIFIAVTMMDGENVLDVGPRVKQRLDELERTLPIGYNLDLVNYSPTYVNQSVHGVAINLFQTIGIVVGVILLFMGVRMGLLIGVHIPLTMVVAIMLMSVFAVPLHRISLATMIISLGLLVDNGINMATEIQRKIGIGIDRAEACISTGKELFFPLLAASTAIILAFMPLLAASYTDGSGEYTYTLATVMMMTLYGSLVLALMVMPLLCYRYIKAEEPDPKANEKRDAKFIFRVYRTMLDFALGQRKLFLMIVGGILAGGIFLTTFVWQQFFPESDRPQIIMTLRLPAGYSIRETEREIMAFDDWLNDKEENPEIEWTNAWVGSGGVRFFVTMAPDDSDSNMGFILVKVPDLSYVEPMQARIRARLTSHHPKINPAVRRMYMGSTETGLIEFRLSGPDPDKLFAGSREIEAGLRDIPGTLNLYNDWENRVIKTVFDVDQTMARRSGLTSQDIANSLQGALEEKTVSHLRVTDRDEAIPISFRAPYEERFNMDRVQTLNVYPTGGTHFLKGEKIKPVPLMQIATAKPVTEYHVIKRRNLERTVTVEAKSLSLTAVELQDALMPTIDRVMAELGPAYKWEWGGEYDASSDSQAALGMFAPHCFFLILVVLVAQFNSYIKPLLVLSTLPLGFVGAIVGLVASNSPLGFMSILGIFALGGIVMSNAIVLLDRFKLEEEAGATPYDAIVQGCLTRLFPVLMTSLTTILGMIPIIVAQDVLFYSLANVIAFGLAVATTLTLLVIPVLYAIAFKIPTPDQKTSSARATSAPKLAT